jgi:hypothetical protein
MNVYVYFVFLAFTSRSATLIGTNKDPKFFFFAQ